MQKHAQIPSFSHAAPSFMTHHALMFSVRGIPYWRNPGAHRIATYLREQDWDVEVCDFTAYWPLHLLK